MLPFFKRLPPAALPAGFVVRSDVATAWNGWRSPARSVSADGRGISRTSPRELAGLAILLLAAAWLRLAGLGSLGLEVDEGFQALAVQGWLTSGLPILPSGMMYGRAIPFGALQALSAGVFGLDEFALRLPAALLGLLAVVATFAFARTLFGRGVAWATAIFIALSAWEVELSRYARFYTAFQVCFTLALLCLYKAYQSGAWRWWLGFWGAALAAMTFHELAVVLATALLIPLLDRAASPRLRATALAAVVPFVGAWLVYRRGIRRWFVGLAPPHGIEQVEVLDAVATRPGWLAWLPQLRLPDVSALGDAASGAYLELVALLAAATFAVVLLLRESRGKGTARVTWLLLAVALGVGHQFFAAALVLVVYLTLFSTRIETLWSRELWPVHVSLAVSLAAWAAVLHHRHAGDWKALTLSLFGFPNVLQHVVYWFALGWPLFLVAVTVAGVAMFARVLRDGDRAMLFLLAAIVMPAVLASGFESYFESRYVFHLYPLLATLFVWALMRAGAWLAQRSGTVAGKPTKLMGTVLALGFLLSGDVGPLSWAPSTRTHASVRDPMRSVISWKAYAPFHQDQATPARHVRTHAAAGDRVAAIGAPHQLAVYRFYAGRLDVAISRAEGVGYRRRSDGRPVDWMTGAELVSDAAEFVPEAGDASVWILGDDVLLRDDVDFLPASVRSRARALLRDVEFRGRDGRTFAWRLP